MNRQNRRHPTHPLLPILYPSKKRIINQENSRASPSAKGRSFRRKKWKIV